MTGLPMEIAPAPDPAAVATPPDVLAAYTTFERVGPVETPRPAWGDDVTATEARLPVDGDRTPVELVEFGGRSAPASHEFVAAVEEWEAVGEADSGEDASSAVHVTPVLARGRKPRPWLALPFPGAGTLADHAGEVDLDNALWLGVCVAEALAHTHESGLVHGALAPDAVRLQPTASEWAFPRVAGFGVARLGGDDRPADARYCAPEHLAPDVHGGVRGATDVYGLGVVLYELLTGQLPYGTDDPERGVLDASPIPPSTVAPTLPASVDRLLLDALATRPADRYDSVVAFRDRLVARLDAVHVPDRGGTAAGAAEEGLPGGQVSAFPFLDAAREEWRADCPACGRGVNNTFESFLAHWRDAARCDGPPETPPASAPHSPGEWDAVVARVEAAIDDAGPPIGSNPAPDHPLWSALAEDAVVAVGGVRVASDDGSYPWLAYPRRGWRVPCPTCGETVFNTRAALKAHWRDAPACGDPPDDFDTA
jgi:uncharacterized protein (DUF983 family)